ncbi:MAG: hypothetical protein ACT4O9_00370 [Blastocatellia bacterium]
MVRRNKVLLTFSLAITISAFLLSFAISFQSRGLDQGLVIGEHQLDEFQAKLGVEKIIFSIHGYRTYELFASSYGLISFLFALILGAIIAQLILTKRRQLLVFIFILNSLVSAPILYNLRFLIRDKQMVEESFWETPGNAFARLTISYDWVLVSFVLIILCLQTVSVIWWRRDINKIAP